jgi:hypothetical protein
LREAYNAERWGCPAPMGSRKVKAGRGRSFGIGFRFQIQEGNDMCTAVSYS